MNFGHLNKSGFSLLELMITVAIIAIITTLASASFDQFTRKVRKNQAKTLLGDLYTNEKIYFQEYGSFTTVLDAISFSPEGEIWNNIGFDVNFPPPAGAPQGNPACTRVCLPGTTNLACNNNARWKCKPTSWCRLDANNFGVVTGTSFVAETHIHFTGNCATTDAATFTIDQNKSIIERFPSN